MIKNNILICTLMFLIIFIISKVIINLYGFEYMQWIYKTVIFIVIAGFVMGMIQKIVKSENKTNKRILEIILGIIIVISLMLFQVIGLFYALTFVPEHIVEKNEQKLVGYVYGFRRKYVDYYEYVNIFVRKTNIVLYEYYEKGEFDPIENNNSQ